MSLLAALFLTQCGSKTIYVDPSAAIDAGRDTTASDAEAVEDASFEAFVPPPLSTDGQAGGNCMAGTKSDCAAGYVCWTALPTCSGRGSCVSSTCSSTKGPICGCDGQVYESECALRRAGVSAGPAEMCPAVADRFACGAEFCSPLTQYCRHVIRGSGLETRSCFAFPDACLPAPDCACLPDASPHTCSACRVIDGTVPGLEFDCTNPPPIGE